ncbi:hypothetical protein CHS0354_020169 [Potamilus streckersoni]|uniref:CCR4-NOT transcription complex subunit 4 n=1 Tax=Potamilus streckersoni TaxID=2493646 RepID=A0AAE0VP61_9BIVA|nr:hypothetical protein CHS0354_020169 [Potamilus streckersoni]
MSGSEEQIECPLCMEPLEIDDINFFPCTCGYQICRFCWHRIRTDENGLCPACRKQYPEDPAEFKPLTEEELQRIKKERRQKDLQRKQKAAENRKHLANVRVVQKNLVFVVGLSQRLADPEVLKKQEYFGKFGKIHKVVINQSTSYAGSQGPSASAYVTYNRSEDALKAIIAVNNVHIDGRTLKASLGTTKYCSHFLRGSQCPKSDCMYLHELGEEAASFTKEEMQLGKHQEYEQKLLEQYMNSQNLAHNHLATNNRISARKKSSSPTTVQQSVPQPIQSNNSSHSPPAQSSSQPQQSLPNTSNRDAWPSLQGAGNNSENGSSPQNRSDKTDFTSDSSQTQVNQRNRITTDSEQQSGRQTESVFGQSSQKSTDHTAVPTSQSQLQTVHSILGAKTKSLLLDNPNSLSLFSSNGFHTRNPKPQVPTTDVPETEQPPTTEISDTIPVSSTTDWQEAFGFGPMSKEPNDDDLGFDPLEESSRGLADLIEKENGCRQRMPASRPCSTHHPVFHQKYPFHGLPPHSRTLHTQLSQPQNLPPGFSLSHIQQQQQHVNSMHQHNIPGMVRQELLASRMMGLMNPNIQNSYPDMFTSDISVSGKDPMQQNARNDVVNLKDWQEGLRALLPNINISFGAPPYSSTENTRRHTTQNGHNQKSSMLSDDSPYWLKSINQLTETENTSGPNHRLPFSAQQFPLRNAVWPPQTHNPPPGFQTHIRPTLQSAEARTISEGLQ